MGQQVLDRLTDRDLILLAGDENADAAAWRVRFVSKHWLLTEALSDPDLIDRLFDPRLGLDEVPSPMLVFAAVIHRVAMDLTEASFVPDWVGHRARLPVFDVDPLREFLGDPGRAWFLIELLASFTRVAMHPVMGGRALNELDPVALASALAGAGGDRRGGLLRRLGDVALFTAGVYPDATGTRVPEPRQVEAMGRSAGLAAYEILEWSHHRPPETIGLELMENLGQRWYRLASANGGPPVLGDVAGRFTAGRRVLTYLSDRYLHRIEPGWFPLSA